MRKFLSLLLALVMVLCCIPAVAETADGVYEGTGTGIGGKIVVAVTIEDGKIANVDIVSHNETEGLGGVALPEYARQTVEKQSLDIDVISGVTVTLDAYKQAVNDALAKAVE